MNLPERPLSSNLTTPSIKANNVSSLPRPTFLPGFHLVPRCRARMLPPSTASPPNFFRPNRCDCESRPLRDDPTPFLCAIRTPFGVSGVGYQVSVKTETRHLKPGTLLSNRINRDRGV